VPNAAPVTSDPAADKRAYRPVRASDRLRLMRCSCRASALERAVDEEHLTFSITLVERGNFTYRTRSGRALLSQGWLMLGNVGEGYACSHEDTDGSGDDCTVLSISPQALDDALAALGAPSARPRFGRASLPPSPRAAALLGTLAAEGAEGFALEETALAVIAEVQRALGVGAAPAERQHERALAAAQCIESRAAEALSLDDVARTVGLSSFHLLRIFRASTGITPHQYLMRARLLRAMALLRDTAQPITDVAYDAGWSDLSNFTRTFRRDVGCSPGEFRRGDRKLLATPASRTGSRP